MKLTNKQIRFCKEYIVDHNGEKAALRAGYSAGGARTRASELLTNSNITNFIAELEKDIEKSNKVTIEKTLNELSCIAFSNVTDYLEVKKDSITLTDWTELSKDKTAAIESIHLTKDGYRIKLYNKPQALEMIGKYLGMFSELQKEDPFNPEFEKWSNEELEKYINE